MDNHGIVGTFHIELYQINMKIAFLNGDLKEEVDQLEGLISGKIITWFVSLKKSKYGLNMLPVDGI